MTGGGDRILRAGSRPEVFFRQLIDDFVRYEGAVDALSDALNQLPAGYRGVGTTAPSRDSVFVTPPRVAESVVTTAFAPFASIYRHIDLASDDAAVEDRLAWHVAKWAEAFQAQAVEFLDLNPFFGTDLGIVQTSIAEFRQWLAYHRSLTAFMDTHFTREAPLPRTRVLFREGGDGEPQGRVKEPVGCMILMLELMRRIARAAEAQDRDHTVNLFFVGSTLYIAADPPDVMGETFGDIADPGERSIAHFIGLTGAEPRAWGWYDDTRTRAMIQVPVRNVIGAGGGLTGSLVPGRPPMRRSIPPPSMLMMTGGMGMMSVAPPVFPALAPLTTF